VRLATAAAEAGAVAGELECMERAGRIPGLLTRDPADDRELLLRLMPHGGAAFWRGELAESAAIFRQAAELSVGSDDPQDYVWRAVATLLSGEVENALGLFNVGAVRARELGAAGALLHVLSGQALCAFYFADIRRATASAHEVVKLGFDLGTADYATHALGVLAWAAALRGDEEEHRRLAEQVEEEARRGTAIPPAAVAWGRAELELARGRWNEALEDLIPLSKYGSAFNHPFIVLATAPSLAEAARRADRPELVESARATIEPWIGNTSPGHALPLLERTLALSTEGAEADAHYEEAIGLLVGESNGYHRARTELLYGEHLRRERRRSEAREHLRAAHQGFERLGAAPWAERTAGELRATGETARKRDPSAVDTLTPQERQIARLVGEGASNKDVAAQLFLSPRTVEYHLRKVFQKLGISSRAELIRHGIDPASAGVA
jgi:ATP/maltotriose-dependent transcriptional regulator MalT